MLYLHWIDATTGFCVPFAQLRASDRNFEIINDLFLEAVKHWRDRHWELWQDGNVIAAGSNRL